MSDEGTIRTMFEKLETENAQLRADLAEIEAELDEAELGEGFEANIPFIKGIATRHKEKSE